MVLTLAVPYRSPGNVIRQKDVVFEIFRDFDTYCITPQLPKNERRLADLPEHLEFTLKNNKPKIHMDITVGNFHIILALVQLLQEQHIITD